MILNILEVNIYLTVLKKNKNLVLLTTISEFDYFYNIQILTEININFNILYKYNKCTNFIVK